MLQQWATCLPCIRDLSFASEHVKCFDKPAPRALEDKQPAGKVLHSPRMLLWTTNILGQLGAAMPQAVQVMMEEQEAPAGNISLLFNLFGVLRK
jgi:hypothetical protein